MNTLKILGMIVQSVAGQPYAAYVQSHIFEPLAMDDSYTSQDEAMQNGMATGHRFWFGRPAPAETDRFLQIVFAVILAGVLLQAIGIIRSAARLRRWQREPERRPTALSMEAVYVDQMPTSA